METINKHITYAYHKIYNSVSQPTVHKVSQDKVWDNVNDNLWAILLFDVKVDIGNNIKNNIKLCII